MKAHASRQCTPDSCLGSAVHLSGFVVSFCLALITVFLLYSSRKVPSAHLQVNVLAGQVSFHSHSCSMGKTPDKSSAN